MQSQLFPTDKLLTTHHLIRRGEGELVRGENALGHAVLRLELELDWDARGEGVHLAEAQCLPIPVSERHLIQAPLVPADIKIFTFPSMLLPIKL